MCAVLMLKCCEKVLIKQSKMTPFLLISALVTTYMCYVQGQSPCTTPSGVKGQCIAIYQCEELLTLVNKPNRTPQDLDLLRKSQCGFQGTTPQVCCQGPCTTPDGKQGKCTGIYSCAHIASMLQPPISQQNLAFVQNSRCEGPEQYSVCCGPEPNGGGGVLPPNPNAICTSTATLPDPSTQCCGHEVMSHNRIIGGNSTAVDQYPWLALIEYKKDNKIKLLCGGALISGRYVLTAGHCVVGQVRNSGMPANVRLGEYDWSHDGPDCAPAEGGGEDCTEGTVIIPIEHITAHPDYNPNHPLRRNDIALIRLTEMAPYTDFIRPICLPTSDISVNPVSDLYAAGWGAVNATHSSSNVKLHVKLPYVSYENCQPAYNHPRRRVALWKGQLCAGGEAGKDSCKGDSGGPLMYERNQTFEVIGVVSFGPTPCGLENIPGVYTNVYEYISWIQSVVRP